MGEEFIGARQRVSHNCWLLARGVNARAQPKIVFRPIFLRFAFTLSLLCCFISSFVYQRYAMRYSRPWMKALLCFGDEAEERDVDGWDKK